MTGRHGAAALVALFFADPAPAQDVQGAVFEVLDQRRVPSADAFVIVHWTGTRPGLGHYESVCIQAAIGRTDGQGRFHIREPEPLRSTFAVLRRDPAIAVFKPGFDTSGKRPEWSLVPTKLPPDQRAGLAEILSGYGCRDDKGFLLPLTDPQGVLPAFRAALEKESGAKPPPPMQIEVLRPQRVQPAQK